MLTRRTPIKSAGFKSSAPSSEQRDHGLVSAFAAAELGVSFPASFEQLEGMQVDPDTGEVIGGIQG